MDPKATPGTNGAAASGNAVEEPSNWRRAAREEGPRTR